MILLASTSDLIQLITSGTPEIDVHASYADLNAPTVTPGRKNTPISTATTTSIVDSPASSVYRTVRTITCRNRHATTSNTVTVIHTDGTNAMELIKVTLAAGETLHYHEAAGFWVADSQGRQLLNERAGGSGAAVNALNLVVLAADVVNNNAVANTIADITGLSFPVTAGEQYFFRFTIDYSSAATATGSRWSISGPASPTRLSYGSMYSLNAGANTINTGFSAYDLPAASNSGSATTTANIATIEGIITPSADGTVTGRFASEISSSAITVRAGSILQWVRTN